MFATLLSTAAYVLGSYAATELLNRVIANFDTRKVENDELTSTEMTKALNAITSEARKRGQGALDRLADRLSKSESLLAYAPPNIKSYLIKAYNRNKDNYEEAKTIADKVEQSVGNLTDSINSYNLNTDQYKATDMGTRLGQQLKNDAAKMKQDYATAIEKIENIEKGVKQ